MHLLRRKPSDKGKPLLKIAAEIGILGISQRIGGDECSAGLRIRQQLNDIVESSIAPRDADAVSCLVWEEANHLCG